MSHESRLVVYELMDDLWENLCPSSQILKCMHASPFFADDFLFLHFLLLLYFSQALLRKSEDFTCSVRWLHTFTGPRNHSSCSPFLSFFLFLSVSFPFSCFKVLFKICEMFPFLHCYGDTRQIFSAKNRYRK